MSFNSNFWNLLNSDFKVPKDNTDPTKITPNAKNQYNDFGYGNVTFVIRNKIISTLEMINLFSLLALRLFRKEMTLVLFNIKADNRDNILTVRII